VSEYWGSHRDERGKGAQESTRKHEKAEASTQHAAVLTVRVPRQHESLPLYTTTTTTATTYNPRRRKKYFVYAASHHTKGSTLHHHWMMERTVQYLLQYLLH
jgi:hypothetical protein